MSQLELLWAIDDAGLDVYTHRVLTHILRRGHCYATNGRQLVKSMNGGMSHVKAGQVLAAQKAAGAIRLTVKNGVEGYEINPDFFSKTVNDVNESVNDINDDVNGINVFVNDVNESVNGIYLEEETLRRNTKKNHKEKTEKASPSHGSISDILPRHYQDFETQHQVPTAAEQDMFEFLMGFCHKASLNSMKQRAKELVAMGASTKVIQREFNTAEGWWYQTTADGKAGNPPFAGNIVNRYDTAQQWREAKKQEVAWSPL